MDIKNLQNSWDRWAKKDAMWAILTDKSKRGGLWDENEFFKTGQQQIDIVIKQIEEAGLNLQRGRALDFGCGIGRLTQALAGYFESVTGVDIAPTMIELAKQHNKYAERCTYFLNEKPDLSLFPDKSFDFIYTSIVLQHMRPDYAYTYIREFSRLLKPEGILIFDLPAIKPIPKSTIVLIGLAVYQITAQVYMSIKHLFEPKMEIYATDIFDVLGLLQSVHLKAVDISKNHRYSRVNDSYIYTCKVRAGKLAPKWSIKQLLSV